MISWLLRDPFLPGKKQPVWQMPRQSIPPVTLAVHPIFLFAGRVDPSWQGPQFWGTNPSHRNWCLPGFPAISHWQSPVDETGEGIGSRLTFLQLLSVRWQRAYKYQDCCMQRMFLVYDLRDRQEIVPPNLYLHFLLLVHYSWDHRHVRKS